MRPVFLTTLSIALLCATLPASAVTSVRPKKGTHTKKHAKAVHEKYKPSHAPMDTERATAIQTALIKQGYLSGEPTGTWDAQSMAAMQKLQSDNGWQTKIVPDSRAIIKLGLGPQSPTPAPN